MTISAFAFSLAFAPGCRKKPQDEPKKVETSKPAAEAPATAEEMKKTAVETAKKTVEKGKQAVKETANETMQKGTEAAKKTMAKGTEATKKMMAPGTDAAKKMMGKTESTKMTMGKETAAATGTTSPKMLDEGKTLFVKNCSPCHPKGGNIINPKETLHKADREANGIKTKEDILRTVRNPGPGMTKFNKTDLPDSDVLKIGEYIINTF